MKRSPHMQGLLQSTICFVVLTALIAPYGFLHAATNAASTSTEKSAPRSIPLTEQPQISSINVDEKNDFVLEPGKMEITGNPGEVVTKYVSVTSRIKRTTTFDVTIEDFIGSHDELTPVVLLGKEKSPYSFKDNFSPSVDKFDLKFGDRITLPVKVTIPSDARPGGYYSSVIISNQPQADEEMSKTGSAGVRIISRAGVLFFIKVNGPVAEKGQLEDFRISEKHATYAKSPDKFQILFNNSGTIHLVPYGIISIKNILGSEVDALPVDAYFSLPDSLRYRDVNWIDNRFRIGRYTATLALHRGYGDQVDTKSISFWIIPWLIVGPVIGGLVLILLIAYLFLSRFELRRKS